MWCIQLGKYLSQCIYYKRNLYGTESVCLMFWLNVWKETSWKAFIIIKIRSTLRLNRKWRVYKEPPLYAYVCSTCCLTIWLHRLPKSVYRISYITITVWRTTSSWIYNEFNVMRWRLSLKKKKLLQSRFMKMETFFFPNPFTCI